MNEKKPYTEAQMDLLRRIERMNISNNLREEINEIKRAESVKPGDLVRGENPVIGFTPNPE